MLDLRQFLMKISDQQYRRIQRLMDFIDVVEEKEFDPLLARSDGYKPREMAVKLQLASKILTDVWGAALKQQMTSLGQQVPDELEALYFQLLSMDEGDVDRLTAIVKVFQSGVQVEKLLKVANGEEDDGKTV